MSDRDYRAALRLATATYGEESLNALRLALAMLKRQGLTEATQDTVAAEAENIADLAWTLVPNLTGTDPFALAVNDLASEAACYAEDARCFGMPECVNCGEPTENTNDNGEPTCPRCVRSGLVHGHAHGMHDEEPAPGCPRCPRGVIAA